MKRERYKPQISSLFSAVKSQGKNIKTFGLGLCELKLKPSRQVLRVFLPLSLRGLLAVGGSVAFSVIARRRKAPTKQSQSTKPLENKMKTSKNLFDSVCSFENLHLAYLRARKCKKYRDYVLEFSYNLEQNLLKLRKELLNQTYQHGSYREFIICDAKKRHIRAAPFRDRVVHHALCNIIEPIFDKSFIYDSYACREDKGTHRAIKRLQEFLKIESLLYAHNTSYCLQSDVSKYFNNIDHQILLSLIQRKIKDQKVIWLVKEILNSCHIRKIHENLFDFRITGIPIGNLTSQLFANIYLNELDQFVKHQLRIKYYIRYMDDFLVLHPSKQKLYQIKQETQAFLQKKLNLELHPKKVNIFPVKDGVCFLGYRNFKDYRLLRKDTVKRFIKRTKIYQKKLAHGLMTQKKFNNSLQSWSAYASFANSWRLRKKLLCSLRSPTAPATTTKNGQT